MALNLKPLADRLVVEPTEQEEVTASGIYVPETAKEKPQKGTVVAVGPGRKDDEGTHPQGKRHPSYSRIAAILK
jgi:chaperonin GroES